MNPKHVDRAQLKLLTDLPNVGKVIAEDLRLLGFRSPEELVGKSPFEMYERLCQLTGHRHDPCVIDVFMSITDFMQGKPPRHWSEFTGMRKEILSKASLK